MQICCRFLQRRNEVQQADRIDFCGAWWPHINFHGRLRIFHGSICYCQDILGNNKNEFGWEEPPGVRGAYIFRARNNFKVRALWEVSLAGRLSERFYLQGAKLGGPVWLAVEQQQQQHWSDSAAAFSPPPATPGNTHLLGLSHLWTGEEGGEGGVTK